MVAVLENGGPVVITTAEGSRLLSSVVSFTKTAERLVGQAAKRQSVINSENTVSSIKRIIGQRKGKRGLPFSTEASINLAGYEQFAQPTPLPQNQEVHYEWKMNSNNPIRRKP